MSFSFRRNSALGDRESFAAFWWRITSFAPIVVIAASLGATPPLMAEEGARKQAQRPFIGRLIARLGSDSLQHNSDQVNAVAFSPDSKYVATCGGNEIIIWDVATAEVVRRVITSVDIGNLVYSPRGEYLAWTCGKRQVYLLRTDTRQGAQSLDELPSPAVGLCFLRTSNRLIVGAESNGLLTYELKGDGTSLGKTNITSRIARFLILPDEQDVVIIEEGRKQLSILAMSDGKTKQSWPAVSGSVSALACSSDGHIVAYVEEADNDSRLRVYDMTTKREVLSWPNKVTLPKVQSLTWCAFSSNNTEIWTATKDSQFFRITLRTSDVQIPIDRTSFSGQKISLAALSPDGAQLAAIGRRLWLYSTQTGKDRFPAQDNWRSVGLSPYFHVGKDGRRFVTAYSAWDVARGSRELIAGRKEMFFLDGKGETTHVSVTRNGVQVRNRTTDALTLRSDASDVYISVPTLHAPIKRPLVILSDPAKRSRLTVFDVTGQRTTCIDDAHLEKKLLISQSLRHVAVSDNGRLIACLGERGNVRVHKLSDGQTVELLEWPLGRPFSARSICSVSPDAKYVSAYNEATGLGMVWEASSKKTMHLFDVAIAADALYGVRHPAVTWFSAQGEAWFAYYPRTETIRAWSLATGELMGTLSLQDVMTYVDPRVVLHLGGFPTLAYPFLGRVGDYSSRAAELRSERSHRIAFAPNGSLCAILHPGGDIKVIDVLSRDVVFEMQAAAPVLGMLLFSEDSERLICVADESVTFWDISFDEERSAVATRSTDQLLKELAAENGVAARLAIAEVSHRGGDAVTAITTHFEKQNLADLDTERLVANLDSERFDERKRAADRLHRLGWKVVPVLERELLRSRSFEQRSQIKAILDKLSERRLSSDDLTLVRMVEVLERNGGASAEQCLQKVVNDAVHPIVRQRAKSASIRISQRDTGFQALVQYHRRTREASDAEETADHENELPCD